MTMQLDGACAGAQIPLEEVPSVQKEVVTRCRQLGKPVIVASQLLQSMIEFPTPTRAEVCELPSAHILTISVRFCSAVSELPNAWIVLRPALLLEYMPIWSFFELQHSFKYES